MALVEYERGPHVQAWARFIARAFDSLGVTALLIGFWTVVSAYLDLGVLFGFVERASVEALFASPALPILDSIAFALLFLLIEPFWVALAGETPGKWLMGVSVTRESGQRMSYLSAVARTGCVTTLGAAMGIPLLSLVALVLNYSAVAGGRRSPWDKMLRLTVRHRRRHAVVWLGAIVLVLVGQGAMLGYLRSQ